MKKMIGGATGFLIVIAAVCIMWVSGDNKSVSEAATAPYFGSDILIPDFPEVGIKGSIDNPFVILEIVPYEGYAEIGYMIDGCEPVPLNKLLFDNSVGGTLQSTGGMTYEWKAEYTDTLKEGDVVGTGPGEWEYLSATNNYRRYRNYFSSVNSFLINALRVPEEQLESYNIQVVTVTPDKLNDSARYRLIDRADLIYLSPKSHYGTSLISIWEKYHPDKIMEEEPQNLYSNDLTWETTLKILEKAVGNEDPAPVIFDVTIFSTDQSYGNGITPKKYYKNGTLVESLNATGYSSNTAKLYLAMQQMEPGKFYHEYIATGRVRSVKVKDAAGNPVIKNGIAMTTGYFMDLAEGGLTDYYTMKTEDDAAVWNIHTLLPYELFENYTALNGNKVFETLGYRIFTYDGDQTHRSVRHGFYAYNGDNSITQIFLNYNISENYYNREVFNFFQEENGGTRPTSIRPADAIYYLLHMGKKHAYEQTELRILEVEPCNDFIWDGTQKYWDTTKTPAQDSDNGSNFARQYFCKYFPHYSGKVKVTTMTSSEFIGKVEDLNSTYDLVLIGLKDGMLRKNSSGSTVYNDTLLNGKIYLHVGDKITEPDFLRGTLGTDDTTDVYRYSGNDITADKKEELKSFMNAGYPVILGEGFLTDSSLINSTKIDNTSQIYNLATVAADNLFFADNLKATKLEQTLSDSKCRIIFGKTDGSVEEKSCYPAIYRDISKVSGLTDQDIYINGESIGNRTLQYKFYIDDNGNSEKTYKVNLYIDVNADGRFDALTENAGSLNIRKDDGYAAEYDSLKAGTNYTLTRNLDENFSGVLPWKLEIEDITNSNNRYSIINYSALKVEDTKKIHLNVLQIMSNTGNNINLTNNKLFRIYTENLNDYVLHFKSITVNDFETLCGNGGYKYLLKDSTETRNYVKNADGTYVWDDYDMDKLFDVDMLILGFADLYSDISNENALENIEEYIDEGKTVLFTHDTTSFVNLPSDKYTGASYWGYHLNQKFRESFGMDRFGVTGYNSVDERLAAGKDYAPDGYIQGYTDTNLNRYATSGQYLSNINFPSARNIKEDFVTNVNKGQLTMYPYEIEDGFKVAKTHSQYYQLDMESDDIVVWYCLSDDSTDSLGKPNGIYSTTPNDVRNNYYIYNKGNITYSGVGHSAITQDVTNAGAVMETKLFVNTIIAAYSASAKEPVINITNSNKSTDESGMDFVYVDYDIYATGQVYGYASDLNTSGQKIRYRVVDNNILYNKKLTVEYFYIDSGTGLEVPFDLTTKKEGSDITVGELQSGTEYCFFAPLDKLASGNRGNTIIIRVTLTYGKSLENKVTVDKKFTLVRRGLFDLE